MMNDYNRNKHFEFGTTNPTLMEKPFWKYMISNPHITAYHVRQLNNNDFENYNNETAGRPVWCFTRFGMTQTYLPDGRLICIGGEHEDSYDPDFQIYNDVIVIENPHMVPVFYMYTLPIPENFPLGRKQNDVRSNPKILGTSNPNDITIYGYPEHIFPPIDFHTATYVSHNNDDEFIYIIGGLGYIDSDLRKETHVYRLRLSDFSIERIETKGNGPIGCTYNHHAKLEIINNRKMIEITLKDQQCYQFDIETDQWSTMNK